MGVQIYRLLISSSCSGGPQVLPAEDRHTSWEMTTYRICRNVLSLNNNNNTIIIIIISLYALLCVNVCEWWAVSRFVPLLVEAKPRYIFMQVLSHKAARDFVKLTICSKVNDGHYNFSAKYLSVLHCYSPKEQLKGYGGGSQDSISLVCHCSPPLHTRTEQYGLSLRK